MADQQNEPYYCSYPNEPIGGGNPYCRCCAFGRSDPEINGRLDGHYKSCTWANQKKVELAAQAIRATPVAAESLPAAYAERVPAFAPATLGRMRRGLELFRTSDGTPENRRAFFREAGIQAADADSVARPRHP